jgi:uncharacterized protein (DUF1800 family)
MMHQPNRRGVLFGATAILGGALLSRTAMPPAFASEQGEGGFSRKALNRLSFGATRESIAVFEASGFEAWLDGQLAMRDDDQATRDRLAAATLPISYEAGRDEKNRSWKALDEPNRPLGALRKPAAELVMLNDWERPMHYAERERPAKEVQFATLIRAVHGEGQLREIIVQFWHDHFNVNSIKDIGCAAYFPLYDQAIRAEALGNFRALLGSIARSPSMLYYLNNNESKASPANENYGRELLELHTLGEGNYLNAQYNDWKDVPGAADGLAVGYIDQDVYEAARAFTGWSVADGGDLGERGILPKTGEFHYIDAWHDPYQKRILGREFRANAPPLSDGETVLDMLANHPGTARFIAEKLCRRLLADDPPEALVKRAAAEFLAAKEAPDQIARVVRLIALSDEFRDLPPSKMKRPFEFVVSLCRATGAQITTAGYLFDWLNRAGWRQHEWRPPTGHPDTNEHWANTNTLATLTSLAIQIFEEGFNGPKLDPLGGEAAQAKTTGALAEYWSGQVLGGKIDPAFLAALAEGVGGKDDALADEREGRLWQARTIIALTALTPEFMTR